MGNFVSFHRSRPMSASLPPRRVESDTQVLSTGRCCLTSSFTMRAGRLIKLLRSPMTSRTRAADVEEVLLPDGDRTKDTEAVVAEGVPRCGLSSRRRALLVGISYNGELLNTHKDVDRYRDVLLGTYGYHPEDITMLKDDRTFPDHLQPTRDNILRELRSLVADAAAGDRFTFLYSGHSNQQPSKDLNEEDFLDEYLITIDDEIIIDNELNDILVKPLPTGCSLFALLDTCHSGTLLDLPHYYCNSVYVPWRSKGRRRTKSWQNVTVRRNAGFIRDPVLPDSPAHQSTSPIRSVLPFFVSVPLSIDRRVAPAPIEIGARHLCDYSLPSSPRFCASPVSRFPCTGWCQRDPKADAPIVVSLAACSDYQRSWESYDGSLTKIVCSFLVCLFLEQNQRPSYRELMIHINFKLHAAARQLHDWTRSEKMKLKEQSAARAKACTEKGPDPNCSEKPPSTEAEDGEAFEGEMDNFQTPLLSSLIPLNMQDVLQV